MSGGRLGHPPQPPALALPRDRGPLKNTTPTIPTLRETLPLSSGGAPSGLDLYLSWMSPYYSPNYSSFAKNAKFRMGRQNRNILLKTRTAYRPEESTACLRAAFSTADGPRSSLT